MAYAYVHDVVSSWAEYERVAARLLDPIPAGLIAHIAGPTDEGVRIIEIWDDEQAGRRFFDDRLAPLVDALAAPVSPHSVFRDLHARHVIISGARPALDLRAPDSNSMEGASRERQ